MDEVLELFLWSWMLLMSSWTAPSSTLPQKTAMRRLDLTDKNKDMKPLFDTILDYIPGS